MNRPIIPILFVALMCPLLGSNEAKAQRSVQDMVLDGIHRNPSPQQRPSGSYRNNQNRNRGQSYDDVMQDELRRRPGMEKYLPKSSLDKLNQNRTLYLGPDAFNERERPTDLNVDAYGDDGRGGYIPYDSSRPSRSQPMDSGCPGGAIPVLGQCEGGMVDEFRRVNPDYQPGGRYDPNNFNRDRDLLERRQR